VFAMPLKCAVVQEHCVHAYADIGNQLNDYPCGNPTLWSNPMSACCQAPVIFGADPSPSLTPTPTSSPRASVCPPGFSNPVTSSSGIIFCYAVAAGANGAGLTWAQALASCQAKGAQLGSLATIRDSAQKTAVITNRCAGLVPVTNPDTYW